MAAQLSLEVIQVGITVRGVFAKSGTRKEPLTEKEGTIVAEYLVDVPAENGAELQVEVERCGKNSVAVQNCLQ